jgi:hypothetical protein
MQYGVVLSRDYLVPLQPLDLNEVILELVQRSHELSMLQQAGLACFRLR